MWQLTRQSHIGLINSRLPILVILLLDLDAPSRGRYGGLCTWSAVAAVERIKTETRARVAANRHIRHLQTPPASLTTDTVMLKTAASAIKAIPTPFSWIFANASLYHRLMRALDP